MSIEINVLFQGPLPAKSALTRAMKELGFPLTILPPLGSLEKQSGFMPMRFRREETGVEFDVFTGRAEIEDLAGDLAGDIDPRFDRSANFRFGGDENEMVCGVCAAAALARLVNGVVLEDGEPLTVDEAIAWATQHLRDVTPPAQRGGTRPADIKRYLKALLKERRDLVLVDRLLLIRPVRHVLRGVLFDRTGDRYCFRIWHYLQDLCYAGDGSGVGYGDHYFGPSWDVWQSHFEPALMDVLAEDVFGQVGRITTLSELAVVMSRSVRSSSTQQVTILLLSGERDRAAEYIRQVESNDPSSWGKWAEAQRKRVADVDAVCAEFHAKEARAAKALKIEHIWEPSPFPAELPAAAQAAVADPLFIPNPWIPRPAWLLQELPEQVGDVRFAKDTLLRRGRRILVASLSREQAEERHRNGEPYMLAARMSDGLALLLRRHGQDREHPGYPGYVTLPCLFLELYGTDVVAKAYFGQLGGDKSMLDLWSIYIDQLPSRRSIWRWVSSMEEREHSREHATDAELDQLRCPKPDFGEFDVLAAMMRNALRSKGYGEIA